MMYIKGGSILEGNEWIPKDLIVQDGHIESIADPGSDAIAGYTNETGLETYDATGMYVLPGAIDMHVHFRFPGGEQKEDWNHATAAAYAGGVTYVCDMPNNAPAMTSLAALKQKQDDITARYPDAVAHGLYIAATETNLNEITAADAEGIICGVKVYYGTSTGDLTMNNIEALKALMNANLSVPIVIHAEDDHVIEKNAEHYKDQNTPEIHSKIRSREAAAQALITILGAVRETGAENVHITHMTTADEVALIRAAKEEGLRITCDVTPHHLVLTTGDYKTRGNMIRVNPPVREDADVEVLWEALADGTVDMVGSDHAPHTLEEKGAASYWDVPSGVPGVQTLLPVLIDAALTGRLTWQRVRQLAMHAPALRFNLAPHGLLQEGGISDMVIVDPSGSTHVTHAVMKSKSAWTPFDGMTLRGRIATTFARGQRFDYPEAAE